MRDRRVEARIDGPLWERLIENLPEDLSRPLMSSIQDASPSNEAIKQRCEGWGRRRDSHSAPFTLPSISPESSYQINVAM